MRIIVLLSGGKDSLFSALHCVANGHELVALANLHPPESAESEDLDSFMYQTVGHAVVPLYEDALGIKLYRRAITGTNIETKQTYGKTGSVGDETEDLADLLRSVMADRPDANAVCSGAILSSYQRTRVESVALRLGLTPLAFLWQYPLLPTPGMSSLLEDMGLAHVDARIVKTASGGLDASHLWERVTDPKFIARLRRDMTLFGEPDLGALLGEGGEYETLAIDGPSPLWKKRICVDWEARREDAGTSVARIRTANLVEKKATAPYTLRRPSLWDEDSQHETQLDDKSFDHEFDQRAPNSGGRNGRLPKATTRVSQDTVCLSNIHCNTAASFEEQQEHVLASLQDGLRQSGLSADDVLVTTILLRNMDDFAKLNTAYGDLFHCALPPARVTIATGDSLSDGVDLVLSAVACKGYSTQRTGLHVQSWSYWAPANIGPYSQAITLPLSPDANQARRHSKTALIAGQIPLVPSSMDMLQGSFKEQALLALQHLKRIGRAVGVHCWSGTIAYVTAPDSAAASSQASMALSVWRKAHARAIDDENDAGDDDGIDIAERQLYRPWTTGNRHQNQKPKLLLPIPCFPQLEVGESAEGYVPGCVVAQVSQLPRAAPIEWVSQGLCLGEDEHGRPAKASVKSRTNPHCLLDKLSGTQFNDIAGPSMKAETEAAARARVTSLLDNQDVEQLELLHTTDCDVTVIDEVERAGGRVIPCRSLWTEDGPCEYFLRWTERRSTKSPP